MANIFDEMEQNETDLNILDFKKIHEISKLHWP
jgi:hypothetical protein